MIYFRKRNRQYSVLLTAVSFLIVCSPIIACLEIQDSLQNNDGRNIQYQSILNGPDIYNMIIQINESTLENHIQTIQKFGPHPTGSIVLDQLKVYLYNEFVSYGLIVNYDQWRYKLRKGENIEAKLPGVGITDGIVIVCAHYDSVFISPGADDDGSGVASILAMAEVMSHYEFNATIKFILFSGEEQGLLGSHEYAKESFEQQHNILGVICLDGVGYAVTSEDGSNIINHADESSDWIVDFTTDIAQTYEEEIDLNVICKPNEPISDHQSFYEYGFATSYFIEYTLDPFYHTSEDLLEYMNMTYLAKVTKLVLGTIATMAEIQRILSNDDLSVKIKGTLLSRPSQCMLRIENRKHITDSANLTIHFEIINILTDDHVPGPYNTTSNWTFNEEVDDYWQFIIAAHYYSFNIVKVDVTITGYNDDIGLYKKISTFGIVNKKYIVIIPKL